MSGFNGDIAATASERPDVTTLERDDNGVTMIAGWQTDSGLTFGRNDAPALRAWMLANPCALQTWLTDDLWLEAVTA